MDDQRYPNGKQDENEKGTMFLGNDPDVVVINFVERIWQMRMLPEDAVELAIAIIGSARRIDPDVVVSLPRYQLRAGGKCIQCLTCLMISSNPTDVASRYCGKCHVFLDDK
jgi:hypothetical protein